MKLPPDERLRADVGELLQRFGEPSTPEVIDPVLAHLRLLESWNDAFGLTRIMEWADVLDRHLGESLLPLKYISPTPGRLIDIGSGNGFPVLPILACRTSLTGVLVERSERKALFLDAVVQKVGWGRRVTIDSSDAEVFAEHEGRGGFDHVLSRATLAPESFLRLATRLVRPGGRVFMYAGSEAVKSVGGRRQRIEEPDPHRTVHQGSGAVGAEERPSVASGQCRVERVASEPIADRRDSYLHILEAEAPQI